jgi:hypothetical protein
MRWGRDGMGDGRGGGRLEGPARDGYEAEAKGRRGVYVTENERKGTACLRRRGRGGAWMSSSKCIVQGGGLARQTPAIRYEETAATCTS